VFTAAYFKTGGTVPPAESSGVVKRDGLTYVVLRDTAGASMAVCRVQNSGQLRRMRRPPKALDR
jgi:hypothetical protein